MARVMLASNAMTRARACLVALALAASSSAASAGTYLGLGVGTAADMVGDSGKGVVMKGNDRSGRLILGYRFGRFSLEATGTRYGMYQNALPFDSTMAALALKFSLPLAQGFEVFGRGGVEHTWLTTNAQGGFNEDGNGWLIGAGVEYRFHLSFVAGGSIFVDYERAQTTFTNSMYSLSYGGGAGVFMAGVTVSI
jgi:hypothetical protein